MDVVEAEEAAKGTDVVVKTVETSEPMVPTSADASFSGAGKESEMEVTPGADAMKSCEEVTFAAPSVVQLSSSEEQQDQCGAGITSVTTPAKRPHAQTDNGGDKAAVSNVEEPPAKTSQSRRSTYRPKPNFMADKRAVDKAPPPPSLQGQVSLPDGSGGDSDV